MSSGVSTRGHGGGAGRHRVHNGPRARTRVCARVGTRVGTRV